MDAAREPVARFGIHFLRLQGAGGPLAASFYVDLVGNYDGVFITVGDLWALGGALMLLIRRPTKPQQPTLLEVLMKPPTTAGANGSRP